MARISPYDVLPSKYDLWNGYSNQEHMTEEAADRYDEFVYPNPTPRLMATPLGTVSQFYRIRVTDDSTRLHFWISKSWWKPCGYNIFRYYASSNHLGEPVAQWDFPASAVGVQLSDAAIVETAAGVLPARASYTLFGLAAYLIQHNFPEPAQLPLFISARNWRYRRIKLGDRAQKAVRLIQRSVRRRIPSWRQRRLRIAELVLSTPSIGPDLGYLVCLFLG